MDKKRLFIWMIILTLLAGLINTVAMCYFGTTVSHVTGLVSNFSINVFKGNGSDIWWFASVILSFFLGAFISGFVTAERKFFLYTRYGWIIVSIGAILALGTLVLDHDGKNIIRLLALLMGLQNGMVVSFKGVVVRMTHMSGNLTDLGVFLGYKVRRKTNEKAIMGIVPFAALVAYIIGGIIGMWLYSMLKINTFYIVSGVYVILGAIYIVFAYLSNDKNLNGIPDDIEKDMVNSIDLIKEAEDSVSK